MRQDYPGNGNRISLYKLHNLPASPPGFQAFFKKHFQESSEPEIELKVGLICNAGYNRKKRKRIKPKIGLGIKIGGTEIIKPQTFLNEGKLTQIALSIRFAATLTQLYDAPLKLLVLDDLLISLDMSNRMKVVEIILGEEFANYQKIILTHKLGFFQEFRRNLGPDHTGWCFKRFTGTPRAGIGLRQEKNDLERAEDHLQNQDLEEAALSLRKAVEELASHYRERLDGKKLPQGFHPLAENLRSAKNKLLAQLPLQLYQKVLHGLPVEQRFFLLPTDHADIDANPDLTAAQKGILKAQRKRLKTLIEAEHWQAMESINLLEKLLGMASRVLNPSAHAGAEPIYEHEVRKAHRLVEQLERKLKL